MPCTLIAEYEYPFLARHDPSDTVPSIMTPICYTLYSGCTEAGCEHPGKTVKNLVLDFDEHGASRTDNGTEYVARPKTDPFEYSGPMEDTLVKKGKFTIWSQQGWTTVDTATETTTAGSQGGRIESGGSAVGTGEMVTAGS